METSSKNRQSRKSRQSKSRVAGQPVSGTYDPDRYYYLLVSRTPEMKRALAKIASNHDSQKQAVEDAILSLASSRK